MLQAAQTSLDNSTQTRTKDFHLFGTSLEVFPDQVYIHLSTKSQANEQIVVLVIWTIWCRHQSTADPDEMLFSKINFLPLVLFTGV